jgi:LysM repeat protein
MELVVGLTVLLVAVVVTVLVVVLRRRRAERERLRGAELRALDARISERLGELAGKPRIRPDRAPAAELPSAGTIEPQAVAVPEPLQPAVAEAPAPQAVAEAPPPPPPAPFLPVADASRPSPMRVGRARPQAVAGTRRNRPRLSPRGVLIGLAAIALLVVVGSQALGFRPSVGQGTPSPTDLSGAVPTGTTDLRPTPEPTITETATPTPTATLSTPSPLPTATPIVYVVQRGDTMSSIAAQYGVPLADLIAANPQIEDPSLIYAGNLITIPLPRPSPTASAAP